MFLVGGADGTRLLSSDGRSWPDEKPEGEILYRLAAYGAGRFVAIGVHGKDSYITSSSGGSSWTETQFDSGYSDRFTALAYGNNEFVAFFGKAGGAGNANNKVYFSDDGESWSEPKSIEGKYILSRAAYGNDRWVAVGERGQIATSTDGRDWEIVPDTKPINTLIDVAFGRGLFVGTGLHGLRMTSEDGLNWSEPEHGKEGEHINSILWTGSQFVGVGDGGTYASSDGRSWDRVDNTNAPTFASYGNNAFVGLAWKGRILYSRDAVTWEEVYKSSSNLEAIAFGSG